MEWSSNQIEGAMGTHLVSFIFRGYDPYLVGLKPAFFIGFGGPKGCNR